jgi:hypothetical protein
MDFSVLLPAISVATMVIVSSCTEVCIVLSTIFVFLSLFHLVVVLSISPKEQFEDTKGVVKTRKWQDGHYNDKQ